MPDALHRFGLVLFKPVSDEGGHQNAIIGSHPEQGQKTHPNRHAEVDGVHLKKVAHIGSKQFEVHKPGLPVEPDHDKPAGKGNEYAAEHHGRHGYRAEFKVEDEENDAQGDGQYQAEALAGPHLLFVGAGKAIADAGRHCQFAAVDLFFKMFLGIVHHGHLRLPGVPVEKHVPHQKAVFAFNRLRALPVFDLHQLAQGDLAARFGGHQYALHHFRVAAQLAGVADAHRKTLPSFHRRGHHHAAHCRLDVPLNLLDGQPVAGNGLPVYVKLQVGLADNAVGEHGGSFYAIYFFEVFFELQAKILNSGKVRPFNLNAHRRAHAGLKHHQAGLDGLQLGRRGDAGQPGSCHDFLPDVVRAPNVIPPLAVVFSVGAFNKLSVFIPEVLPVLAYFISDAMAVLVHLVFRLVQDDIFVHGNGGRVEGAFHPAHFPDDRFHLRDGGNRHIERPQVVGILLNTGMRHGGRHQQEGAFIEGGHKFLPGIS